MVDNQKIHEVSKPAARIGDMHVCPMVTPGTPPIPHVGGPITGPGVPTVFIGGLPAAVMGDMCVCTGPPDSIILGSTGVLIGGKPAARMGDSNAHGGTIVAGCPTVLIGETSGGGGGGGAMENMKVVIDAIDKIKSVEKSVLGRVRAAMIQIGLMGEAAHTGNQYCEVSKPSEVETKNNEPDIDKKIKKFYFADAGGNPISKVDKEKSVYLVIESENIAGEEVLISMQDHEDDFTYQGNDIPNNELTIPIGGDTFRIELGVKINNK